MAVLRIGTSGWSYPNWKGAFYPKGLKQRDWLAFYAEHFIAVELNASFYRLPGENALTAWAERTPENFRFAVKAWRAITHYRRLRECEDLVKRFYERIALLGAKAEVVVFQLPPRFPADPECLGALLAILPESPRVAFEFRDPSWHTEAVYNLLRQRNVAFVPFVLAGEASPRLATADFVYVRLHGPETAYAGAYSDAALEDWADWLSQQLYDGRDAYLFFDNTEVADDAIRNARTLNALLEAKRGTT